MVTLKFVKGLSYQGFGVKVSAKAPFLRNVEEELAVKLLGSGHFALVEDSVLPDQISGEQTEPPQGGEEGDNGGEPLQGGEDTLPPSDDLPPEGKNAGGQVADGNKDPKPKAASSPKGGKGK